ncbi:3-phosphoserine/phosphohydroxythreonine transaminase [Legionella sp. CNM-4043-24]|uniref:3-phosphoserine/phosphohydroxythreonine transaminase n=1 Tax=Legionella sp. CNM-4043-24 TaxID=3421646 RepID=UPI00403ADDB5
MSRPYNFGAGPAMLPDELLLEAQSELLDWQGSGMSIMEIGHRTKEYAQLMKDCEDLLRTLLTIPDNYRILFLGSPARQHFSMVPMNLLAKDRKGAYIVSGLWSAMALDEGSRLRDTYCIASSEHSGFRDLPDMTGLSFEENTDYLYYTPNETVNGVRCPKPAHGNIPLVADMTSCLLTETINVNDYGLIFAGAQKNIANSGLSLVIVRDDVIARLPEQTLPKTLDYRIQVSNNSLYATPPTFNCYLAYKMFQWIQRQGGVKALETINQEKASRLYSFIDASTFYSAPVAPKARSLVNVCFSLKDSSLDSLFLEQARARGLLALQGHREVGGMRASMYNSMPIEGVDSLIAFMDDFARQQTVSRSR